MSCPIVDRRTSAPDSSPDPTKSCPIEESVMPAPESVPPATTSCPIVVFEMTAPATFAKTTSLPTLVSETADRLAVRYRFATDRLPAWRGRAPRTLCSGLGADSTKEREMRRAFMSTKRAFVTYLEGMTLASQNAQLGNRGACRRR
jgi:hypothetical protein